MKRKLITTVVLVLLVVAACTKNPVKAPDTPSLTFKGQLYGVVLTPRDSLPLDARLEKFFKLDTWTDVPGGSKVKISLRPDGEYEIRCTYPTDSLQIFIDSMPATIHEDGAFEVPGVTPGNHQLRFVIAGMEMRTESCTVRDESRQSIDFVYDPMLCAQKRGSIASAAGFRCLDNNGVGVGGFIYSDCFENLFFGSTWYKWMCWAEGMDHILNMPYGNVWCNSSHTCSLFVHSWNWNAQNWHRHYSFWWPSW